ncbi:MAG: glycosyl hydrolase family 65 protein [Candidatus Omnitrophota bacterium]
MKNYFSQYLSAGNWQIEENGWDAKNQAVCESQFTLGNGCISSRGALEENPYDSSSGTYLAGLFDNTGAQVTELVNIPNPFYFKIVSQGEKLDNVAMDVLEHKRILDMKKGILLRKTVFLDSRKKRFSYESLKCISMSDKHLGFMRIYLTALDSQASLTIQSGVDTSVVNKGVLTEGRKKHFYTTNVSAEKNISYVEVQTFQKNISIAYGSHLSVISKDRKFDVSEPTFKLKLKKGETVCFTRIFSTYSSLSVRQKDLKTKVIKSAKQAVKTGFDRILNISAEAWAKKWNMADIKVSGDKEVEKALRFNIYHMIISASESMDASVGARTLSGDGYRGHIFWDTEFFMLPIFTYTFPKIAKNLLKYRYNRLDAARKIAKNEGYKGALFPWESADGGEDVTPTWAKDLDGTIIEIKTMDQEMHINSDIAYGLWQYYDVTKDEKFLTSYGAEILFETAKFWVSKAELNKKTKEYEIKNVMGPDEFHEDINNNAYTNIMARWNLIRAYTAFTMLKAKSPAKLKILLKKIKLKVSDIKKWRGIASSIKISYARDKKLIEAFDGYFNRRDVRITAIDRNFMPLFPKGVTPRNVGKTKLIKQADVVMLLYLMPDIFSQAEKRINYAYYEKRTLHKSSLSVSTHSIMASETGNQGRAFQYFFNSLMADLRNLHGNTREGMHAASLGGTWQAVINGFCGMRIRKGNLSFYPNLPDRWKGISFKVRWRNNILRISIFHDRVAIFCYGKKQKDPIFIGIYGKLHQLEPGKINEFHKLSKGR